MSEYTLNDIKYNPTPLTLCAIGTDYKADRKKLDDSFKQNRELMKKLQSEFEQRKLSGARII